MVLALRWAEVLGVSTEIIDGDPTIPTADGPVTFIEPLDGRPEGLGGINVKVSTPEVVLERAADYGLQCYEQTVEISGLRFHLAR
jgi:hypothetical protein